MIVRAWWWRAVGRASRVALEVGAAYLAAVRNIVLVRGVW